MCITMHIFQRGMKVMFIITKDNIIEYLKKHIPELDDSAAFHISMIGEGTEEEDGDGYVNYIFRVQSEKASYVLKQATGTGRVSGFSMGTYRNKLEYDSQKIRYAIVPEYTPALYFQDEENNIFVMEDVSHLSVVRFQMNQNKIFPIIGRQCGECMAKTEFYTSEFYQDRSDFRKLITQFENDELRKIMEDGLFMDRFGITDMDPTMGKGFEDFAGQITGDYSYRQERLKLRRNFITHTDALIHADFHTSNIMADENEMKLIDMEFSFMGPFGYDLGYLAGSILSQYCAACFKPFDSEQKRFEYKAYLLASIKDMFRSYFAKFTECWNEDAKPRYQNETGLRRSVMDEIMRDAPGYASIVNWFRCVAPIPYPDFDVIEDVNKKRLATTLSLLIDWQIMFARYTYQSVDDLIDTVLYVEKKFMEMI